jgi:hypothetical protein
VYNFWPGLIKLTSVFTDSLNTFEFSAGISVNSFLTIFNGLTGFLGVGGENKWSFDSNIFYGESR